MGAQGLAHILAKRKLFTETSPINLLQKLNHEHILVVFT
jgi:hypothetical protein